VYKGRSIFYSYTPAKVIKIIYSESWFPPVFIMSTDCWKQIIAKGEMRSLKFVEVAMKSLFFLYWNQTTKLVGIIKHTKKLEAVNNGGRKGWSIRNYK